MMSLIVPTVLLRALSVGSIPIMAPGGGVGGSFSARFRRVGGSKRDFLFCRGLGAREPPQ